MTAIGSALRQFALDDSYLSDQLGERMRPVHLEQGDEDAAIAVAYNTISTVPDESLAGDAGHTSDRIQYDVYADDEDLADQVAGKLRKRLLAAAGSLDVDDARTVFVTGVSTASGVRDLSSLSPIDGSQTWRHRLSFDLFVSYNPPD